eukprot:TRINITY_DN26324_c0_g1_i1.p2 TRINITY_DN26324_c0_g1~~TRINITY_DN26324_c0_g1_i1.p2  ORF type:complete len:184 (+),score=45.05 TRINITY_DN26324_c0_g1_i1:24-554(+)
MSSAGAASGAAGSSTATGADVSADEQQALLEPTWRLDWEHSDSPAPVMAIAGAPWFVRALVGRMSCDVTIRREPDGRIRVTNSTLMKTQESVFTDDGAVNAADEYGEGAQKRAWWERDDEDRPCLVHETVEQGKGFSSKVSRCVIEEGRMRAVMEAHKLDGSQHASVTRFFNALKQ